MEADRDSERESYRKSCPKRRGTAQQVGYVIDGDACGERV